MNTKLIKLGSIPLSLSLAVFAAGHAVHAQTLETTPPIKMGLWQTEAKTAVSGAENTPLAREGQRATVTQGCLTPDTWKSTIESLGKNPTIDCKVTNMHQDSQSLSFDEACSSERYNSDMHFQAQITDNEHMQGSAKVKVTAQGLPQPMTMNMTLDSHFLSSSCGDVKPGEGKVISHE